MERWISNLVAPEYRGDLAFEYHALEALPPDSTDPLVESIKQDIACLSA
jgi:hypothetical protein